MYRQNRWGVGKMDYGFNFEDKVVIVTGAAMGIGKGIAAAFAQFGAKVVIADINAEAGQKTLEEIRSIGGTALFYQLDASSGEEMQEMVADVAAKLKRIDILVNNVGMNRRMPITEMSESDWRRVIDVNLTSHWLGCKTVAPHMIEQKCGKIINLASNAAYRFIPEMAAYSASKCGVVGLTKVLAVELAQYNIQVNGIAPGYVETPLTQPVMARKELFDFLLMMIPQHRFGRVNEVVSSVLFLASDMAAFITGSIINVDGGASC